MNEDPVPPLPEAPPSLPARVAARHALSAPPPPALPSPDDRTIGMLMHLLGLFTGFLGPLILWLVNRERSPFQDHHGKEALNFQIFYMIVSMVLVVITMVTLGFAILVTGPALIVIAILFLVWEIQACIAASRGEWYRYPLSIRFVV